MIVKSKKIKLIININIKGIIHNYLSIKYKSKEIYFNYLKGIKLNKSNSLNPDYNLFEMKLLHINIEYEIDANQKALKSKSNNISKKSNKFVYIPKKNKIKKKDKLKIFTNKYWEKYSLLNKISFFMKNKPHINTNDKRKSLLIKQFYHKFNRNSKMPIKHFLKNDVFKKLKELINTKKESQFEYECFKIIKNYDINTCDEEGNTLLALACMNREFEIVKYLLKNGANPNCINSDKNTPLHYALANHDYPIADLLIQNGANDYLENKDGETPWK
jgi:hypothetical protein